MIQDRKCYRCSRLHIMADAVTHERQAGAPRIETCIETNAARSTARLVGDQRNGRGSRAMAALERVNRSSMKSM